MAAHQQLLSQSSNLEETAQTTAGAKTTRDNYFKQAAASQYKRDLDNSFSSYSNNNKEQRKSSKKKKAKMSKLSYMPKSNYGDSYFMKKNTDEISIFDMKYYLKVNIFE